MNPRGLRPWIVAMLLLAASSPRPETAAQSAPPPPPPQARPAQDPVQQPPVIRTGTNIVRVDVTVTNRDGESISNLTKEDFEVTEDGVPQTIESFEFVRLTGEPVDERSLPIRSPEHAANEAAREDVRLFLIFWDEYHIHPFIPQFRGREMLTKFVKSAFGPTDLVGMMDQLTTVDSIRFTRNWLELSDEMHRLKGRLGVLVPPRSPIEEAHLRMGREIGRLRNEVTLTALKSAAAFLGTFREGRKAILFVSQGVAMSGRSGEHDLFQDVIRTANANNTAIYTLDPSAEVGRRPDSLLSLAYETGGKPFVGTNQPAMKLKQFVSDASAFYLLGYSPPLTPVDGKFHRIKVRVKKPGTEVHARSGYYAPTLADMTRASEIAAAAELPPEAGHALGELSNESRADRPIDLWIGTERGTDGRTRVRVAWARRPAARLGVDVPATVTLTATAPDGQSYYSATEPAAHQVTFEAPPGDLVLKTSVRTAAGEEIDAEARRIAVPDFPAGTVTLGSPVVLLARSAQDVRSLLAGDDAPAWVGRHFARTDRLFIRFSTYAAEAELTAQLLNRQAKPLLALPVARINGGEVAQIDLPLSSIARGDYLVAIEARQGDASARAVVPVRIR
jgi:VWFA-related protein